MPSPRPQRRTAVIGGVIIFLCLTSGGTAWWWSQRQSAPRFVTQTASIGDIERSITMTGTVEPLQTVQVGSYVSGIVKEVRCDYNSAVTVGQICARIDPEPFRLVVEQNKADIGATLAQMTKDQAALTYARVNFARDSKLLQDGVVSADTVDIDRNTLTQAEAQITLDQATLTEKRALLHAAEVNLGYTDIQSPVEGTVITKNVDVGQTVVSNLQSATLFLIAKDLTQMQVEANVAEADIAAVKLGQAVTFTVQAFPDRVFEGTVKQIRQAPITVQSVVTYDVVVAVANPDKQLLPGMTADTHIITAARHDVLRVPLAALRFRPSGLNRARADGTRRRTEAAGDAARPPNGERRGMGGSHVWVLRDQGPVPVPVKPGLDDGSLAEISSDQLQPGDKVIVSQISDSEPRRPNGPQQQQAWRPPGQGMRH